jgi:ribosomal-protein-alanine N-acetyltransferase
MSDGPMPSLPVTRDRSADLPREKERRQGVPGDTGLPHEAGPQAEDLSLRYRIDRLDGEPDLEGVLEVEAESFTNPWTRDMYAWELQNRSVCHIYVVRTDEVPVVGFCAFWLVFDEIHINNVAMRPPYRGRGLGTALLRHVMTEAGRLGAKRATLEVRASNSAARRLYERLGFYVAATRRNYYTNPVEDALILWRDDPT